MKYALNSDIHGNLPAFALGLLSVGLLLYALRARLAGERSCPVDVVES
jgi:hypothetical protein